MMLSKLKLICEPAVIKKIIIILLAIFVAAITTSFGMGIKKAHGQEQPAVEQPAEEDKDLDDEELLDEEDEEAPAENSGCQLHDETLKALAKEIESLKGAVRIIA